MEHELIGRRAFLALSGGGLLALAVGCSPVQPSGPTPSPALSPSAAQLDPIVAGIPQIIAELMARSLGAPIVRVQVDHRQVTLTQVDRSGRPVTLLWQDGEISQLDEGSDFAVSSSFDPRVFNLDDVPAMFAIAAQLSGSDSRQQLQITEHSNDQILMTVTTNPESMTVFFRPDGSVIWPLSYATADGIAEALQEASGGADWVLAVGISDQQLWVDVAGIEEGTVERRIRPSNVPVFSTLRSQSTTDLPFARAQLDPLVITKLLNQLPSDVGKPKAAINVVAKHDPDWQSPRLIFDIAGTRLMTDLAGNRVNR